VVGAENVGVNEWVLYALHKFLRDEKIVDPPAHIPIPRAGECIPIGVGTGARRVRAAVYIYIARIYHFIYPGALLGQEPRVLLIRFRAGQVYFFVGGVHIPAEYDRF
jgi:hypothetical protein